MPERFAVGDSSLNRPFRGTFVSNEMLSESAYNFYDIAGGKWMPACIETSRIIKLYCYLPGKTARRWGTTLNVRRHVRMRTWNPARDVSTSISLFSSAMPCSPFLITFAFNYRVVRNTRNPVYEEDFTFYGLTMTELKSMSLHFVVLSFDRYSRDDVIGEVVCPFSTIELHQIENQQVALSREIQPRSLKVRSSSANVRRSAHVCFSRLSRKDAESFWSPFAGNRLLVDWLLFCWKLETYPGWMWLAWLIPTLKFIFCTTWENLKASPKDSTLENINFSSRS